MIKRIETRIVLRRQELEHMKADRNWAKCLKLEAQILELQGVLIDYLHAAQPAVEVDAEKLSAGSDSASRRLMKESFEND